MSEYRVTERRTGGGDEYVIRDGNGNHVWSTYNSYHAQEVIAVIEKANAPLYAHIAVLEAAIESAIAKVGMLQDEPCENSDFVTKTCEGIIGWLQKALDKKAGDNG